MIYIILLALEYLGIIFLSITLNNFPVVPLFGCLNVL